jgi:hypothetical protein
MDVTFGVSTMQKHNKVKHNSIGKFLIGYTSS